MNPAFQENELDYALKKVGIKTLVMTEHFKSSNYIKIVRELIPELAKATNPLDLGKIERYPELKNIVLIADKPQKGMINFRDLSEIYTSKDDMELQKREKAIDFESPTNIQFTSGTTGYPKGATLSHFNILNNSYYFGSFLRYTPEDKVAITVPLYHCFGMVLGNLAALNFGATMVYPNESFDPVSALEAVTKHKCTSLYGVPTMLIAMLEEYAKHPTNYDITSLRTGFVAGSGCPEALLDRLRTDFQIHEFTHGYG